jgi:class III poly(R)-hydroxyalkanoic acid synthase PhaE subunit
MDMTNAQESLYEFWLKTIAGFFGAMMPVSPMVPGVSSPSGRADVPSQLPFPVDQVARALQLMNTTLGQVYQAYLPLLQRDALTTEALQAIAGPVSGAWVRALAGASDDPGVALGNPLLTEMERTLGALADALGLGPTRQLNDAWREVMAAAVAKQGAQAEYLAIVLEAWRNGTQRLLAQLAAIGAGGERIDSLLTLIRLWARAVDGAMHETLQSEQGLEATARVVRASVRHRHQLQKAVGLASEAFNMPTRAEVDQAYREIQELKRELRRLKKAAQPAAQSRETGEAIT